MKPSIWETGVQLVRKIFARKVSILKALSYYDIYFILLANSLKLVFAMDALFGLPRKKSAGTSFRSPLYSELFFMDQCAVDQFVSENSGRGKLTLEPNVSDLCRYCYGGRSKPVTYSESSLIWPLLIPTLLSIENSII